MLQNRTVEHLAPKGFRRDRENPDFYIMFNGRMGDSVELIGGYRFKVSKNVVWETYAGPGWSRSTGHGLVILYMQLPEAEEPFWGAGFTTDVPQTLPPKQVKKVLERAAKKLVKVFPPGA